MSAPTPEILNDRYQRVRAWMSAARAQTALIAIAALHTADSSGDCAWCGFTSPCAERQIANDALGTENVDDATAHYSSGPS
jgi:hypothetical protein